MSERQGWGPAKGRGIGQNPNSEYGLVYRK